ncbi:MAG: hypothetical protein JJT75_08900 [Opitutales bacterium]|nr:hypothetical protein [Opitutales bacterium]MCH8539158.1 hypothetical protein [Opitutales bacterium]
MEPSSNQPNPGKTRELNLQRTAEQFMAGIQKHFDMLAFNLASRQKVTEEAYLEKVSAAGMIPVQKAHQNFEQMQAYARDLMTAQVMNDNLNLAVSCMHQVHFFLILIRTQKQEGKLSPELQKAAQQEHQKFMQTPIDQKFNLLEEQFGVMAELEDGIMALAHAMQAMSRQRGVVQEAQLDESKALTLELKKVPSFSSAPNLGGRLREMETVTKVFREGEKITLSDQEMHQLLFATAAFAHQMFSHVARFAKDAGAGK